MAPSSRQKARPRLLHGLRLERAISSKRYREGRFHNSQPGVPRPSGSALPTIGEFIFAKQQRVPGTNLPLVDPLPLWLRADDGGLRITWLGHSTVLIEIDGCRVLTDPVFADRVSPLSFVGPKRFHPVPARIDQLPPLDAVLISHDHYDHLCYASVLELGRRQVPFITSLGVGARLEAWGIPHERIVELDWWEEHVIGRGPLSFTATPSQHFSGRSLGDRNLTAWSGWVIRSDRHKVFFSGDTGLTDDYKLIGQRLGPFDLVMLEIGAFHPAWGDIHLGPANALKALAMLGGGTLLPVHWGTFSLALHAWDEPAETLWRLAAAEGVRIITPRLGEPISPLRHDGVSPWWRR